MNLSKVRPVSKGFGDPLQIEFIISGLGLNPSSNYPIELMVDTKLIFGHFLENKIDCTNLKETLGEAVDDSSERYSFTWAGKEDSLKILQTL